MTTVATATIKLYNKIYDKNIQELYLCDEITNVCPEIGKLQNLRKLDLSDNQITNVCPEIGQLKNLQILNVSYNQVVHVCPEIGQLQNLQILDLMGNHITYMCPEIGLLQRLSKLDLRNNQITNLCPEIGQLRNLQILNLINNRITNVCPEIGQLQNLQYLNLSLNKINNICPEIGQLQNLQYLDFGNNRITIIPADIIQCNNLVRIEYHDNNIEYYIPCVQRFLDRIKNAGGTIVNIYNDGQNVHTSSIQTSIKNSIFNLLNTRYKINEVNNYIEDSVLTIKTKELITEYISLKETHSNLDCTFEEIFKAVWNEILTFQVDFQNEVKKRLNEEMDDAECKCFTGRISRLVNCLSGYSDKVLIHISDAEQIGNIISHVRSKYNDSDSDTIKQIVRKELTERKFKQDIINEWISYLN